MKSIIITVIVLGTLATVLYISSRPSSELSQRVDSSVSPSPTVVISSSPLPIHTIGQITHHAQNFVNQTLSVEGYVLARENGYAIFSDESGGAISSFDLPVVGPGITTVISKQEYILRGKFLLGGLVASNHNQYHLELSSLPQPIN